ncbi:hypothetical protein BO86DRAFT_7283 [Aspergillus japonicus CBS 114.51]|uniref:Uncharacterized protein n=1 Tax=Aspergillus japonicus CBS 114.51 TaxID=1448312 RepID=A0A8T8XHV3_ASPJA|nr:hypothetical protein BO86DRAFT_7283 [Aspergillus japonicus CBS 114.51]RAH87630.1 hypothetical protein BO86DRAFT_7283 [Aspergillus japonicus CBS 114.51]
MPGEGLVTPFSTHQLTNSLRLAASPLPLLCISVGVTADRVSSESLSGRETPSVIQCSIGQQMEGKLDSNCQTSPRSLDSTSSPPPLSHFSAPMDASYHYRGLRCDQYLAARRMSYCSKSTHPQEENC